MKFLMLMKWVSSILIYFRACQLMMKSVMSWKSMGSVWKQGFRSPPPWFWNNSYWSRAFWNDRSRLLIGRERTATTSCKLLPLLLLEDCLRCFNETEDLHQKKNLVNNGKNQSCSKLPEMARKLIKNYFLKFLTIFFFLTQSQAGSWSIWGSPRGEAVATICS